MRGRRMENKTNSSLNIPFERAEQFYIAGNATCQSSIEGIYAANAVNKAKQYIQPGAPKIAMVSSHNEVFQERNRELVKQMIK